MQNTERNLTVTFSIFVTLTWGFLTYLQAVKNNTFLLTFNMKTL